MKSWGNIFLKSFLKPYKIRWKWLLRKCPNFFKKGELGDLRLTLFGFMIDFLSCFACVIIDNEKMCLSLLRALLEVSWHSQLFATAPFVSLSKSRLRLLSLFSFLIMSDSSSKKYASHSFTPVLRKRKIGRKLRSTSIF